MNLTKKSLQDLNLLDRFLFAEAMEDPVIMQNVLEIILGKDICLKHPPQTEKEQRTSPLNRFIKLDVWARDSDGTVYDTEVQQEDTKNLPMRSRYYQSLIDCRLLPPGEVDFNRLSEIYIILIAPFDLFGHGLYCYTFHPTCDEVPGLALKDKATRIFLNTHGTNSQDVNPELIELLKYMEHTNEAVSERCASEKIHDIQRRIQAIKSSEEIGVKYMQAWEERILEQNKAREEGLARGRSEGLEQGRSEGQQRLNHLYSLLIKENRADEIARATEDPDFLDSLYREFHL